MARQVNAAALTQQITIQQRTSTTNARGETVDTWSDLHTGVWAAVLPLRGREAFQAEQMQNPADVRFTIRHRTGIDPTAMRIVHAGQPFDIVGQPVDVDGRRRTLEIMATHGVRDGR